MRLFASAVIAFLSLAFIEAAFASHDGLQTIPRKRHPFGERTAVSRRLASDLQKRFDKTRFSFFDTGLGACGKVTKASDFIVAMNVPQFAGGAHCFETVTIHYQGKTAQAQVVDECMECPYGALDFSRGLFDYFASESAGLIYGSWTFGAGDPPPQPKPSTTSKPPPPPTTTSKQPDPTTTKQAPRTTSKTTSTNISASSTSSQATSSATPSPTPTPTPTGGLDLANQVFLNLGAIAARAAFPN